MVHLGLNTAWPLVLSTLSICQSLYQLRVAKEQTNKQKTKQTNNNNKKKTCLLRAETVVFTVLCLPCFLRTLSDSHSAFPNKTPVLCLGQREAGGLELVV